MKVLLRYDIPTLGKAGEVKEVKDGYARNYLFPRKLAAYPTQSAIERIQHESRNAVEHRSQELGAMQELARRIQTTTLHLKRKATTDGRLYGGIHPADIINSLNASGIPVPHESLKKQEPIKAIGTHTITLRLPHGIVASCTIEVSNE